jgi:acyl dehydratase
LPRLIRVDELPSLVGQEVAVSDWLEITQDRIDRFAKATGDLQWIHLDADRAAAESPYGTTIAHGFLTLSLVTHLSRNAFQIDGPFRMGVNYGLNRVRFPAPVPSGARVRARFTLEQIDELDDYLQFTWGVVVEVERAGAKPCLAAEWLTRAYL